MKIETEITQRLSELIVKAENDDDYMYNMAVEHCIETVKKAFAELKK